jgi:hypothetical protein
MRTYYFWLPSLIPAHAHYDAVSKRHFGLPQLGGAGLEAYTQVKAVHINLGNKL